MDKKEILKDYIDINGLNIEKIINNYNNYVYKVLKSIKNVTITDEDMEEIISDTFYAIWKNSTKLSDETFIKPYLVGILKNILKNKYRKTTINESILDYENKIIDLNNLEDNFEQSEKFENVKYVLKKLKDNEYDIFIMYYYEGKKIKEISKILNYSEGKVKVILYRIRKKIKKNLSKRGYGYGK